MEHIRVRKQPPLTDTPSHSLRVYPVLAQAQRRPRVQYIDTHTSDTTPATHDTHTGAPRGLPRRAPLSLAPHAELHKYFE